MPALDGVRALAIFMVVAYHLGLSWAGGGYLGVDLFFVLSGFLITTLLVSEHTESGRIDLRAFWIRRARRLLPALSVMLLLVVSILATTAMINSGQSSIAGIRVDALSSLFYVANWHELLANHSYFAQFSTPSPLQHAWSLAIEEQFYLLWPVVLLWLCTRVRNKGRVITCLAAATMSALWMAWLSLHGAENGRLYFGTDTRAFDLLLGAALAFFVIARRENPRAQRNHTLGTSAVALLALGGLLGIAVAAGAGAVADQPPSWMFRGGFFAFAVMSALLLTSARKSGHPLSLFLSCKPVAYLGRISYGIYLWHWPVIVELNARRAGFGGWRLSALQLLATLILTVSSFYLIERPLRRPGAIKELVRASAWPFGAARGVALSFAASAAAGMILLAAISSSGSNASATALGQHRPDTSSASLLYSYRGSPGAGGIESQVPVRLRYAITSAQPLVVLLVGDSVLRSQAPALAAALSSTDEVRVVDHTYPGWGLYNDTAWKSEMPAIMSKIKPDLVLATWSWDDNRLLSDPHVYRSLLMGFVRTVLEEGRGHPGPSGIFFEQFPDVGADPAFSAGPSSRDLQREQGIRAWNAMVSSLPARFPGKVVYLPVGPSVDIAGHVATFMPPPGAPSAPAGTWIRVRAADNTHFCPAGAARYSGAVLADLTELYALNKPSATWPAGRWQRDSVYREPAGICPDDHP